jgi:hypothetical protein
VSAGPSSRIDIHSTPDAAPQQMIHLYTRDLADTIAAEDFGRLMD